jgi:hypothetical protein
MAESTDYIVVELPRGENDVLRVTRRIYEGKPFTDLRVYFRGTDGALHPTKKGTSIRDRELPDVLAALQRIAGKVGTPPTRPQPRQHQQREIPGAQRQPQDDNVGAVDDDERRMAEELF